MADYAKVKRARQTAHYDKPVPMLSKYTVGQPHGWQPHKWTLP